jgi:hypothetical protein
MESAYERIGEIGPRVPNDPRYEVVIRPAGRLACGDLVREPVLGVARITAIRRAEPYVQLTWSDENGPCTAAGRYPVDQPFPVRVPHPIDRLKIDGAIQQAAWTKRAIRSGTARLIAAHMNRGVGTALRRFAADGAVTDALFEELEQANIDQPDFRPWAHALARYCLDRDYQGPMSGWGPREHTPQPPPGRRLAPPPQRHCQEKPTDALAQQRMPTDTARQLIDAAFAMGLVASRSAIVSAKAKWIIREHIASDL